MFLIILSKLQGNQESGPLLAHVGHEYYYLSSRSTSHLTYERNSYILHQSALQNTEQSKMN